jgi:hypothetical protein
MSSRKLLIFAPLGLGALLLVWGAMSARRQPEPKPARPASKPAPVRPAAAPIDIAAVSEMPVAALSRPSDPPAGAAERGENSLIEERVRKMEERLLSLEAQRNVLADANRDLERQLTEKHAEASARMMAEWRVRTWEQTLGLTQDQKQRLLELAARWQREDAAKQADRDAWLRRESDVRSILTAEQTATLHASAVAQSQAQWNHMGRTIGGMVGASKEDQSRFQLALGEFRPSNAMLLPEGYGADFPGLMKDAFARLTPMMSPEQISRLGKFAKK